VTTTVSELEANPSTLEARSAAICDGVYKLQEGLIVCLDPRRLRPLQLARSGLFGAVKPNKTLETK
jgi:purine-binding chemotaxis protein CheW